MKSHGRPDIIELFGLPGAGKTALCRSIGDRSKSFDVYCSTRFDDSWRPLGRLGRRLVLGIETLRRPRIWLALGTLIWRLRLWLSARAMVRLARLPLARVQLEIMPRTGQILMDQALLQDVWSILLSANGEVPPTEVLSPFLAELYGGLSVHILTLEVDAETAARRVSERPNGMSRFDGLPKDSIFELLADAGPMTSSLVTAAGRSGLKMEKIDATRNPSEVVETAMCVLTGTAERPH